MAYMYPYGDTQQLNLSWFLAKFKELYEYVMQLDPSGETAMDAILSRFTEQYDSTRTYIPGDYTIYDGYIYKANTTTGGTFDSSAWDAALPVNDVQGLRILLGGLSEDLTTLEQNAVTNTQYTPGAATADGLLRQTKNGAAETVMTVDKEPTENSQNPVKSGAVFTEISKKSDYVDLGAITGTTKEEAIENAYRSIIIYDKPILFKFSWSGQWSGIAYKYSASNYGTIYATFPVNNASFFGYMINDVFYVDQVARESEITSLLGSLTNKLFIKSGTISSAHTSSTTTTLATDTSKINANTDIANVWFNTPANITSDYTITTNASGQVQITCTNSAAVTVYVVLFNP